MGLTKTSNVSQATIGDTITFCITYKNDSSATKTISIWDSLSAFVTYVGCDSSCSRSGQLVSWSIAGVAVNGTGTVCVWGTVNGYPWLPELLKQRYAVGRREDLEFLFGLLPLGERAN